MRRTCASSTVRCAGRLPQRAPTALRPACSTTGSSSGGSRARTRSAALIARVRPRCIRSSTRKQKFGDISTRTMRSRIASSCVSPLLSRSDGSTCADRRARLESAGGGTRVAANFDQRIDFRMAGSASSRRRSTVRRVLLTRSNGTRLHRRNGMALPGSAMNFRDVDVSQSQNDRDCDDCLSDGRSVRTHARRLAPRRSG